MPYREHAQLPMVNMRNNSEHAQLPKGSAASAQHAQQGPPPPTPAYFGGVEEQE
jgi:hypothetical protein